MEIAKSRHWTKVILLTLILIPGFTHAAEADPPVLNSIKADKESIDVTNEGQTVTFTVDASDETGVDWENTVLHLDKPGGGFREPVGSNENPGEIKLDISQTDPNGTWLLTYLYLKDLNGNQKRYELSIEVLVEGGMESDPPVLNSIKADKESIDVTNEGQTVTFTVDASDETGVDWENTVLHLDKPGGGFREPVGSNENPGEIKLDISQTDPNGTWLLTYLYLKDLNGNQKRYELSIEVLVEGGMESDPPVLNSIKADKESIDVTNEGQTVTFTVDASDETGVDWENTVLHLDKPGGGFREPVGSNENPGEIKLDISQTDPNGTWLLTYLYLKDLNGNQKRYELSIEVLVDFDSDGDDVIDRLDAFPLDATETLDTDSDGTGNNADTDDDGDGVADGSDAFPLDATETIDTDNDGTGNTADTDDDGDAVLDTADAFSLISLGGRTDTDGDGRPNDCDSACVTLGMTADTDDDGDGFHDLTELNAGTDGLDGFHFPGSGGALSFDKQAAFVSGEETETTIYVNRWFSGVGRVSVDYQTKPGSAKPDLDYKRMSGTLVWEAGDTDPKAIKVPILRDPDGSRRVQIFEVLLNNPSENARLLAYQHRVSIAYRDNLNYGGFIYPDIYRVVAENAGEVQLRVRRLLGSKGAVDVDYRTAQSPFGILTMVPGTLHWDDGDHTDRFITVQVPDNEDVAQSFEFQRAFIRFDTPRSDFNATIGGYYGGQPVTLLIADDEWHARTLPIQVGQGFDWVAEEGGTVELRVQRLDGGFIPLETTLFFNNYGGDDSQTLAWEAFDVSTQFIERPIKPIYKSADFGYEITFTEIGAARGVAIIYESLTLMDDDALDEDADGVPDYLDFDLDNDGIEDILDDDVDGDGLSNVDEAEQGLGDPLNADTDGDGDADGSDAFPLDATETLDTDSDGTGNNADTDDDGDGYSDAFESNSGTNALDALSYPSSGGYINARAWLVRGDQLSAKAKVRVQRLFSSKGAVSVNFRTLDGVNSKAGDAYVAATGTLNWLEGDEQEKVIEIDLISDDQYSSHNFYVELYDPSPEGALLGWKTMIYYDGFFLNKKLDDFAGFLSLGESESTFGEGTNNVIWLNRFQASNGTAQIKYSITGCSGYLDEVSSDPREAVITWADGDAEPKPIQLNFLENELNLNRRLDCTFRVYLSEVEPTAAGFNSAHVLLNYGPEFLVYNNDFDRPVVHAAQALMGTSEGEKEVEIKIVRRGPPIRESVINIADTLDLTGYSRYWQFAKSGTHFDYPATAETLTWAEGDASTKSIFLSMKDDELLERDELVVLEPSGDDFDSWRYLYVYSLSDEPILLDGDIDQDGIPDREDADMDGDGLLDWWDLDRDGDGYSLESDSHWWDPNQSIDSDYDGVADNLDWAPEDPGEQFDTDSDGTGNNADTDDDGDGVADTSDAFPLDATETLDTDADGTGNNADPDDDGDGVLDTADAFPLDTNETVDTDSDGTGNNADPDDDGDGVLDTADAFSLISLGGRTDTDGDGRPNDCDSACVTLGMTADSDDDNDGILDTADAFSLISLGSLTDTDGDGRPNDCDSDCVTLGMSADTDDDNDGVLDTADAFSLISLGSLTDTDGDGRPNDCDSDCVTLGMTADTDDDNDGVLDTADAFSLISLGSLTDTDGDGRPNDCDSDCVTAGYVR